MANSASVPDDVRRRLISLAGKWITERGPLIIESRRFCTQSATRKDLPARALMVYRVREV